MSTQNERSIKAQVIWNSTNSNSVTPTMVGSLLYDINVEKLERDNSNAVYQTYDASYTKVAAINPTTKKMTLIDITDFVEGNLEIKSNKSDSYTASSSTTYASTKALVDGLANKLDKGTYTGTASDLKYLIDAKISGIGTANYISKFSATGTIANSMFQDNGSGVGLGIAPLNGTNLYISKSITGSTTGRGLFLNSAILSDTTSAVIIVQSNAVTQAASFNLGSLRHFQASQSNFGAGSTVTVQEGFTVRESLIGATFNYGFRGLIPAGTNRYNLYMDGTALNYLKGNLGIDVLNPSEKQEIAGRTKSDGIVINETTSAILPREIKFKSGNFVAAGNDGVEKKLLREGDAITLPSAFKYGYGNSNVTSNNVFGIEALNSNTTGSNNAAFGRSLVLNTTGSRNSAFGSYACLFYNTSGNDNSAFGYSALFNNSTASFNTAFGSEALLNSNANYNSAFGYQSLKSNTSGTSNMAVGAFALMNNSTGSNNTAYGQGSLSKNTTASTNTAIGTASASELTTGGSNVCIGAWAGAYLPSMSSASSYSNCTYIGEFSKASANGVTNEIAIGKDSKGQGSNTATIGNENTDTLHLLKNGAGIVLKSPDGTKKVKISIDNSGNLITTLIV